MVKSLSVALLYQQSPALETVSAVNWNVWSYASMVLWLAGKIKFLIPTKPCSSLGDFGVDTFS